MDVYVQCPSLEKFLINNAEVPHFSSLWLKNLTTLVDLTSIETKYRELLVIEDELVNNCSLAYLLGTKLGPSVGINIASQKL